MNDLNLNLDQTLNLEQQNTVNTFHNISGIVHLPSKENARLLYQLSVKEDSEHPSGFSVNLFAIKNFISNNLFSKQKRQRICWAAINADDGYHFSVSDTNSERAAKVRNNNAFNFNMLETQPVFNALSISESRLSTFPVCPSADFAQSDYAILNREALNVFTAWKYFEEISSGELFISLNNNEIKRLPKALGNNGAIATFKAYLKNYLDEYARLTSIGALIDSAVLYIPANACNAIVVDTASFKLDTVPAVINGAVKQVDVRKAPKAFSRLAVDTSLRIIGKGVININKECDILYPAYTYGISNTGAMSNSVSSDSDEYTGTQFSRREVSFDTLNGKETFARVVMFSIGNASVRNGLSRAEIFEEAISRNDVIHFENGNLVGFESRFEPDDNAVPAPWCVTARINVQNYSLSRSAGFELGALASSVSEEDSSVEFGAVDVVGADDTNDFDLSVLTQDVAPVVGVSTNKKDSGPVQRVRKESERRRESLSRKAESKVEAEPLASVDDTDLFEDE